MLAIVDLDTDTLHDALESLDTVLIPWLESSAPSLTEEDVEREYVKMALQVIEQYDPNLDEAKRTYYVYQLVAALKELAQSPDLPDIVNALRTGRDAVQSQPAPIELMIEGVVYQRVEAPVSVQETVAGTRTGYTKRPIPSSAVGRLPDLPTGQPLRERPQVRYDVTPQPSDR